MHYDTFPVIEADPNEFKKKVEAETETQVQVLAPGEKFSLK
jgi:L-ascorbate metabolism protein UlaG (beta-lactamase superfamily)